MAKTAPSNPPTAKGWFERGNECKRAGNLAGALDAYRQSIKLNQHVAAPWIGLAQVLHANSQFEDARQCLIQATIAEPGNLLARQKLAASHKQLGYVEHAMRVYEQALALDPSAAATHLGRGQLLEDLGQPQEAAAAYRQARTLEPPMSEALANLLSLGDHIDLMPELEEARNLLPTLKLSEKAQVGYGLGKAYEQRKDYDAAFDAYAIANAARREAAGQFDRTFFDARIEEMMTRFSEDFFAARREWGDPSERPVFIVGLPRSGTTLTEQILASHPQCFGAGELNVLTDLATGTPDRLGSNEAAWPQCAPRLSAVQLQELGRDYIAQSAQRAPATAVRVIDKQPLNFWHLGLIAIALPNARIIHCTRDIRDCGLSIFTQNFNLLQNWSTDLGDIAHYWQGYRKLMAHWSKVTGLQILEVTYEDTVSEFKDQAARLLDFVSLPWNERVLQFHQSERAVQTPSRWQVRQPLYQTSKARWRHYESHLAPLIEAAESGQ